MLTEAKAKEKWCPEQHASAVAIIARGGEPATADVKSRCIASGCMAWRWNPADLLKGYCGLAGKPCV